MALDTDMNKASRTLGWVPDRSPDDEVFDTPLVALCGASDTNSEVRSPEVDCEVRSPDRLLSSVGAPAPVASVTTIGVSIGLVDTLFSVFDGACELESGSVAVREYR